LADDVEVGPFTVIGANVEIGADCWIASHVVIDGPTRLGRNNQVYSFATLGGTPQDQKYRGEPTVLEIGDGNRIREYSTLSRGTALDKGVTRIGDDNLIMAYCHIAHDCQVGNHTVFANGSSLAGHVLVDDHAILGGFTLIHQFCRIGAHSFCAMNCAVRQDVPPFVTVAGDPATPRGLNNEGLRRRGFSSERQQALKWAYRTLYRSGLSLADALAMLTDAGAKDPDVSVLADFIGNSNRGIVRP
jgi:UDP-N-acetylglucosamine acyltransferase